MKTIMNQARGDTTTFSRYDSSHVNYSVGSKLRESESKVGSIINYHTSIQAGAEQFLENDGSGDVDACNKHLDNILDLFYIKYFKYFNLSSSNESRKKLDDLQDTNEVVILTQKYIKKLLENGSQKLDNELDNVTTLAKKLITVGVDVDYKACTGNYILYRLTHVLNDKQLENEYKLAVQKTRNKN